MNCCCRFGAAVSGEYPEWPCPACPIHLPDSAHEDDHCKRHRKEKSMTDDIVEWLRRQSELCDCREDYERLFDAAAEIERLRAKVERLESRGINEMQHEIAEQAAEIERLRHGIAACCVGWDRPPHGGTIVEMLRLLLEETDDIVIV